MKTRVCFFLICFLAGFPPAGPTVFPALAMGDYSKLVVPQIKYRGGSFKPRPDALESLLVQVANRTSIEVKRVSLDMELSNPGLFDYPLVYLAGNDAFPPFSPDELNVLRNYLSYGGFLLIDDNSSVSNSKFDASVRGTISELFPRVPLQKLPEDHSIFRSFYLLNQAAGRALVSPYIEGISIKGRTVLAYVANDLGGAWSRDKLGHWTHDMVGGGEDQRNRAIRLGVNIVLYALTLDYKKDMVHLPIILERLRRNQYR
ncbi:MAG: DUF4159 domain-containing protein [Nitrospinae bacterium]|nr:DUF4159 domain-containing protein [Nitrospinota bacterium]